MWVVYILIATLNTTILNYMYRISEVNIKSIILFTVMSVISTILFYLSFRYCNNFLQCFILCTLCSNIFNVLTSVYLLNEKINMYIIIGLILCTIGTGLTQIKNN